MFSTEPPIPKYLKTLKNPTYYPIFTALAGGQKIVLS